MAEHAQSIREKDLMTTLEASKASGASIRQLQKWDEAGLLRPRRLPGHRNGIRDYCALDIETARRLVMISATGRSRHKIRQLLTLPWKTAAIINGPTVVGDILVIPRR